MVEGLLFTIDGAGAEVGPGQKWTGSATLYGIRLTKKLLQVFCQIDQFSRSVGLYI